MSFSAASDTKERIRQAVDIVELVGGYLELRRQGRLFVGLCPWHDDSRPSLQVNPQRQSWKCWVCDVGGDIFSFVMQREGVEFREALAMLAERAAIPLAPANARPGTMGGADDKRTLYQAMAWATQQYNEFLVKSPDAAPARQYFDQRRITPDSYQRYHLGFAPNQWQWLIDRARTTPFSIQVLEAVGLIARSSRSGQYYDRFKGRVIFPIRDLQGRTIALGGRILPQWADEKAAKYINSPETRLFSKSEHLYGLDTAVDALARDRHVIIVEGYTDALMAWQNGLANVAAVLGTALGPRHIRLLRRVADTITLVLDGDEAGQRRTSDILELFVANQIDLRIATLPEGLDPCDFLVAHGPDAFRRLLSSGVDALEHRIQLSVRGLDPLRDTHRANQALEEILSTIARAPRLQSDTTGWMRMRQEQILVRLAREFRVDESQLRSRLGSLRRKVGPTAALAPAAATRAAALGSVERELLELLTQYPDFITHAAESIPATDLDSPAARAIYEQFLQLHAVGREADFGAVLSQLEEPELKNLLVALDEQAAQKGVADPRHWLDDVIAAYGNRKAKQEHRAVLAELENSQLDGEKEMELLQQILCQKRQRQGISAPTDG